ncbi:sulfotransferase [Streptomyces yaizuensis]|uniref:Sulfotransferase n=1 Tax=Streptomyces yaizuensis TaxID=2989713 RepID=A0ABQ5NXN9_9ACTN|nr:sulfotransferase [Streptomyces sp. YSPA8]GLF95133.1 sulfotransferase [Streptomyces sp. YSPA8]
MTQRHLTFIVGTGRCGSTALSHVLSLHPDVLSLSELFTSMDGIPELLRHEPQSGQQFWAHLTAPNPHTDRLIRSGITPPELLYIRTPGRRYAAETTGIPALAQTVLPHLTDDPDTLMDLLEPQVTAWPVRRPRDHWAALFRILGEQHGDPRVVVERSGLSLSRIPALHRLFPRARFIHLHRNGPDCALSMSRHPAFRLNLLLTREARRLGLTSLHELGPEHTARLPPGLAPLLHKRFDPALLMEHPIPLPHFGHLWTYLVLCGLRHLAALSTAPHLSLSYESLILAPRTELTRIAEFAGFEPSPAWLTTATGHFEGTHRLHPARDLPPDSLAALRDACAPGTRALASQHDR